MPFGKYKGKSMADVPASYLLWVHKNFDGGNVVNYVQEYIDDITFEDGLTKRREKRLNKAKKEFYENIT